MEKEIGEWEGEREREREREEEGGGGVVDRGSTILKSTPDKNGVLYMSQEK